MRRVLAVALVALLGVVAGAQFPYVIDDYNVSIELRGDGKMSVAERIRVTFNEPRHGIFRFIPIQYDTGKGVARTVFLSKISVEDESGDGYTTKMTREGGNLKVRVGDADVLLQPGTSKTYVFKYDALGMINWFDNTSDWQPFAELYWNLTGDQWDTEILKSSFTVSFPNCPGGKGVRARVFAGPYGSRNQMTLLKPAVHQRDDNLGLTMSLSEASTEGSLDRLLMPGEGLTLVLDLPIAAIAKPTWQQQAYMFVLPNLGFGIPILILAFMGIMFWKYGRDPYGGPVVVQFDPPDGLSGSQAGTLLDERVDQRDVVAGVITLAVKGHLIIHPKETGLIFKKRSADLQLTDKAAGDLGDFEASLLARLKSCRSDLIDETDLRTHVAPYMSSLKQTLFRSLVAKGYYKSSPESARVGWAMGGIALSLALGFLFTVLSPLKQPLPGIVGGVIGAVIVLAFTPAMSRRTKSGAETRQKVAGFEEFMSRAQGQELAWMEEKHPDQLMFESYLPHAVAFGLTEQWAKAFEGIVKEMPTWYAAPYGTPFHSHYFASDLVSINSALATAASTPPRSSGGSGGSSGFSSGGGFSGGGFGGGGGGSW